VIGDRIKEEIRVGNSCGMATAWYRCGKFAQELPQQDIEEPKYIITNLEQVLKLIFDEKKN
jgi:ribonucleotide monophosphatase NagD (HAD superfamily)